MGDLIKAIYGNSLEPIRSTEKSKKADRSESRSSESKRSEGFAASLIPDLHDKVEISEEGRQAARAESGEPVEAALPEETTQAVSDNWLSVGYQMARETLDS